MRFWHFVANDTGGGDILLNLKKTYKESRLSALRKRVCEEGL